MLLSKSFGVPVEPVKKPAAVVTSEPPFFDTGARSSMLVTRYEREECCHHDCYPAGTGSEAPSVRMASQCEDGHPAC